MEAPVISFERYWKTSEIKRHVKEVSKRVEASDQSQMIFVIEECAELIHECTTAARLSNEDGEVLDIECVNNLIEEACDVLGSTFVLLDLLGISPIEIEDRIIGKHKRACERFDTTGYF